jgi:hypothetical protein
MYYDYEIRLFCKKHRVRGRTFRFLFHLAVVIFSHFLMQILWAWVLKVPSGVRYIRIRFWWLHQEATAGAEVGAAVAAGAGAAVLGEEIGCAVNVHPAVVAVAAGAAAHTVAENGVATGMLPSCLYYMTSCNRTHADNRSIFCIYVTWVIHCNANISTDLSVKFPPSLSPVVYLMPTLFH